MFAPVAPAFRRCEPNLNKLFEEHSQARRLRLGELQRFGQVIGANGAITRSWKRLKYSLR
jgi:hypothetical protein